MLNFAEWSALQKPLLDELFDFLNDMLNDRDMDLDDFLSEQVTRVLSIDQATSMIKDLHKAYMDKKDWWILTDYHWLLLYDVLEGFVEMYNDGEWKSARIKKIVGDEIDFDDIVGIWFHDTDFLSDGTMGKLSPDQRKTLGVSDAAWSIANGLKAHPDELIMKKIGRRALA